MPDTKTEVDYSQVELRVAANLTGLSLIGLETMEQRRKYSNEHDDAYTNRELLQAARMYLVAGQCKDRGYEEEHIIFVAAGFYPECWGGFDEGSRKIKKLDAIQCLTRSAALTARHIDTMKRRK